MTVESDPPIHCLVGIACKKQAANDGGQMTPKWYLDVPFIKGTRVIVIGVHS
jgi:hypothetical protein